MNLDSINLLDLQTSYMKKDPTTIAMCKALEPQFKKLNEESRLVLIYSRIDYLNEEVIDELAWQMHVDFYDYTLSLNKKRELVKNSLYWHKIKGTPKAVLDVATSVFGRTTLEEWFEYNDEPFFFRLNVEVTEQGASKENIEKLETLVNAYKNTRSWIRVINIFLTGKGKIYFGACTTSGEEITVYPWAVTETSSFGKVNLATKNTNIENITIYPKKEG
ncbi:phage tail protein I [Clostridium botulinum]|nr:phage tail protein I [Clostridium botulinum]MBO0555662.1 phage tail protein I [Clostridium botulinum]